MIYFVDEESGQGTAYPIALKIKGFDVATIPDATRALDALTTAERVELVVVDVMLARGLDPAGCFSPELTERGLRTGLRLLELLSERRPSDFPQRAALLSAATSENLVRTIAAASSNLGIPYWKKESFRVTRDFCNAVVAHLESLKSGPVKGG